MKTSNSLGSQVKVWTSGTVTMAAGFEPLLIVKIKPGVSQHLEVRLNITLHFKICNF